MDAAGVFLRSFLAFSKIASIAPCKGGLERNLLSLLVNPQAVRGGRAKRKTALFPSFGRKKRRMVYNLLFHASLRCFVN
ncbi:MAG: hypothetical protein K2K74_10630, partial [Lachnospiraceae bacterium]|nr:hypothetical protein [Lachnospiraceae bacterium]